MKPLKIAGALRFLNTLIHKPAIRFGCITTPLTKSSPDPRRRRRVQRTVRPNGLKKELAMVINETQRVNLNAAADALLSCAWALQEALKQ